VARGDRWLASMALWLLGDRTGAKEALVVADLDALLHPDELAGAWDLRCVRQQ